MRRAELAAQSRRLQEQAVAEAHRRLDLLYDPDTPAGEVAAIVWEQYEGDPVLPGAAALLVSKGRSLESLQEVADALDLRGDPLSLTALTFRALVARERGDLSTATQLLDRALLDAEAQARLGLAAHLTWHDRAGAALRMLREHLSNAPDDESAVERYGVAARAVHTATADSIDTDEMRLRQAESALFADRGPLYRLRAAIEHYATSRFARPVGEHVAEWLAMAGLSEDGVPDRLDEEDLPAEQDLLVRMALEHAFVVAGGGDDTEDCVLAAFAADPGNPPELRRQARGWFEHARYGLWQIGDPRPEPGLWCQDVLTSSTLYVQFGPEQLETQPRWATLLGLLVPVDGVWRSAGAALQLSPAEADAVCETIRAAVEAVAYETAHDKRARKAHRRAERPIPFGQAEPHGVLGETDDAPSPVVAHLVSMVTGVLLPRIYAELSDYRAAPPRLTNTDGDPMVLISAGVRVNDLDATIGTLAAHPDFRLDDDGTLTWLGLPIPAAQRAAMLAEARAQLAADGKDGEIIDTGEQQRWVRGQLHREQAALRVSVNSAERLDRLMALLASLDAHPEVIERTRVDPAQDLAWPAGRRLAAGTLAPPEQGWEKQWLDEPVPALRGATPRQAATGPQRARLEALLREFEYEQDLRPPGQHAGPDIAWLRTHLNMPDYND